MRLVTFDDGKVGQLSDGTIAALIPKTTNSIIASTAQAIAGRKLPIKSKFVLREEA